MPAPFQVSKFYILRRLARGVFATSVAAFGAQLVSAETLEDALISAYNTHPGLMAERAKIRELDETYVQANSQGRLTSSFSGSAGYNGLRTPSTDMLGQPIGGHSYSDTFEKAAQVQVIQPIYQGGRVRALKDQAKAGILAARQGLRAAEQALFVSVATAYSDVLRDERGAQIRRNNVRVLSRQKQAAADRFEVGVGTRTDVAQAETRLAIAESGLAQADAQLQTSRAAYIRLVGHPPHALEPLPRFELPPSIDKAAMLASVNNPQLIALRLNERGAEAAIDGAKSASKPSVFLNGTIGAVRGQQSFISKAESAALSAQVTIPIFSGGMNKSKLRSAHHAKTRMMFETRDAERQLTQNIHQIWAQKDAAQGVLKAARVQVKSAQVAFEGVEIEQEVGIRTTLDVLNAEQELLDAKLSEINARAAVATAEFNLLSALGGFDAQAIQLPVERYDPNANFAKVTQQGLDEDIVDFFSHPIENLSKNMPGLRKPVSENKSSAAN